MVSILVAYADIILLVKNREAMLAMLDTLRKFLKERKLVLNANKPKVLIFNKNWKEKTGVEMARGIFRRGKDV